MTRRAKEVIGVDAKERAPCWVHCKGCGYNFIAFFTPIPLVSFIKLMPKFCLRCHGKELFMGRNRKK